MWQILINGPGYFDTAYDLPEGSTLLGRADENDIVLSGDLVSRRHGSLSVESQGLWFSDMGSRNGSRVNGAPAGARVKLKSGDTVLLGENLLTIHEVAAQAHRLSTEPAIEPPNRDVRSGVILAKSVSESFVHRALDNIFPLNNEDTPSPVPNKPASAPQVRRSNTDVTYESLLLVSRVAELLATAESLDKFLSHTVDLVIRATAATTGVVLVHQGPHGLKPAVVRHRGRLSTGEVPVSHAIINEAMVQGEALAVADVRRDPRFSKKESAVLYGAGQVVCIPLGKERPFTGALYLNLPPRSHERLEPVLDACTAVAHLIATALDKFSDEPSLTKERMQGGKPLAHSTAQLVRGVGTVLYADLAGFTSAAKQLEPRSVAMLLERFYKCFARVVGRNGGQVSGFVGDSALALFGGDDEQRPEAVLAVQAALALRAEWHTLSLADGEGNRCSIKAGLHTGALLHGNIRVDKRPEVVVVGDPVNTSAWLVGLAGPEQVLMTHKTLAATGSRFEVKALGERHISGRQRLSVYEVQTEVVPVHARRSS